MFVFVFVCFLVCFVCFVCFATYVVQVVQGGFRGDAEEARGLLEKKYEKNGQTNQNKKPQKHKSAKNTNRNTSTKHETQKS